MCVRTHVRARVCVWNGTEQRKADTVYITLRRTFVLKHVHTHTKYTCMQLHNHMHMHTKCYTCRCEPTHTCMNTDMRIC